MGYRPVIRFPQNISPFEQLKERVDGAANAGKATLLARAMGYDTPDDAASARNDTVPAAISADVPTSSVRRVNLIMLLPQARSNFPRDGTLVDESCQYFECCAGDQPTIAIVPSRMDWSGATTEEWQRRRFVAI